MQATPSIKPPTDEIPIKDIVLQLQGWFRYFRSKWLIILLIGLAGCALGAVYALFKKPTYVAKLSFVLEESKSPLGAYAGLASQVGIDFGSGAGSGIFSEDNIVEFLKSRLMVERALLSPVFRDQKMYSLADDYLAINGYREDWEKKGVLKDLHFPATPKRGELTRAHDSILNIMHLRIISENLIVSKPDKKLSFIEVECKTPSETFSKSFTERLVKEATDFYVDSRLQRSRSTIDKLQARADSIETLLNKATYGVAASRDINVNLARSMGGVRTELIARDKMVLQTMYAEVVKNLEISRMAMAQETPLIQVVDTPILPLKVESLGLIKGIVLGGITSGILVLMFLTIRRLYKQIMN